ncbi:subtilase-type protease inhibitor [Streptomyces sp. NBC_00654]|uniref:SSI family serine proteinase inhibitor n=1 Tax=Streptomyces sp. NBC_00654 TaxID=2975799 RepID=UPI002254C101|nr:SSI family serine proteinase inhibitor [Streptomyces sp. NBC_00654]MCX4963281.1 subtilase-type protease inhibitor [Streptomyces sp. NBC_00654]
MLRRLTLTAAISLASLAALSAGAPAATAAGPLSMPIPPLPVFHDLGDGLGNGLGGGLGNGQGAGAGLGRWLDGAGAAEPTRLTVTVSESGDRAADGVFELQCAPTGGSHPQRQQACDRLTQAAGADEELFAPTPADAMCTQMDGGPAAARVVGTWRGRHIDTTVSRSNGCEISRWNRLVPLLPTVK